MGIVVETPIRPDDQHASPPPGKPCILVVDDEGFIRDLFSAFLQKHGFRVMTAAGGETAVELYLRCPGEISLILLDVRMPGMTGPEALATLRRIDPDVRCCFMSGDLGDYTVEELMQLGAIELFPKPVAMFVLLEAVRRLTGVSAGDDS